MRGNRNCSTPKMCLNKWIGRLQDAVLYYINELMQLEYRSAPPTTVNLIQDMLLHYLRLLLRASILAENKGYDKQDTILRFLHELRYTEQHLIPERTMGRLIRDLNCYVSKLREGQFPVDPQANQMKDEILYCIDKLQEAEQNSILIATITDLKAVALQHLNRLCLKQDKRTSKRHSDKRLVQRPTSAMKAKICSAKCRKCLGEQLPKIENGE